jgi:hypothetical protein
MVVERGLMLILKCVLRWSRRDKGLLRLFEESLRRYNSSEVDICLVS